MVGLLGQRDELLRLIEGAFPVTIHVRGNEITVRGDEAEAERVARLFEEMVALLESQRAEVMVANTLEGSAQWAYVGPPYERVPRRQLASRVIERIGG